MNNTDLFYQFIPTEHLDLFKSQPVHQGLAWSLTTSLFLFFIIVIDKPELKM